MSTNNKKALFATIAVVCLGIIFSFAFLIENGLYISGAFLSSTAGMITYTAIARPQRFRDNSVLGLVVAIGTVITAIICYLVLGYPLYVSCATGVLMVFTSIFVTYVPIQD